MTKKSAGRIQRDTLSAAKPHNWTQPPGYEMSLSLDTVMGIEANWRESSEMMVKLVAATVRYQLARSQQGSVIHGTFSVDDMTEMLATNTVDFNFDAEEKRWNFTITPRKTEDVG